jgi:hypothetical protein
LRSTVDLTILICVLVLLDQWPSSQWDRQTDRPRYTGLMIEYTTPKRSTVSNVALDLNILGSPIPSCRVINTPQPLAPMCFLVRIPTRLPQACFSVCANPGLCHGEYRLLAPHSFFLPPPFTSRLGEKETVTFLYNDCRTKLVKRILRSCRLHFVTSRPSAQMDKATICHSW